MKRKNHEWLSEQIEYLDVYIQRSEHPSSLYRLEELRIDFNANFDTSLSIGAIRGAVLRRVERLKSRDVREG